MRKTETVLSIWSRTNLIKWINYTIHGKAKKKKSRQWQGSLEINHSRRLSLLSRGLRWGGGWRAGSATGIWNHCGLLQQSCSRRRGGAAAGDLFFHKKGHGDKSFDLPLPPALLVLSRIQKDFPGGASGKDPACQCRSHTRCRVNLWVRKIPGGRHDNPLHYSCLENPMDRGAWWATIHRVTKSQRQLKWLRMHAGYKKVRDVW